MEQKQLADECDSFEGKGEVIACAFYTDNYLLLLSGFVLTRT
jgi:hypothetical protein